jgi:RHS repeat-associated protein
MLAPAPAPALAPLGASLPTTHRVITYTYDSLYRLITATYSSGEFYHYTYDAVGNRQSLTTHEDVINCQYDAANRLTSVNGQAYTWDDNGNLLSDGLRTYTYDHANRLTQVVSGTLTTEFAYNGAGDRVAKTVDGVTTDYVLDPAAGLTQVLQETTGGQTTSYLYGADLLAQYDSGTWAYYVNDGLGSVRQLADPVGQVVAGYSFSPFGVPLGESGGEPYGYTGEQWDASTGLVFLRARYYAPEVGRFVSKDPFAGYAHIPQSLNRWVYIRNNPVRYRDPSGWFAEGEIEEFVRQRGVKFFSIGAPPNLGFEPWLLEALKHPLVNELLIRMESRIQPSVDYEYGEFSPKHGGTMSSLYKATHGEAHALLSDDGLCGVTDIDLEAAHLSLIVLAGIPATEHYQYRPKETWEHYPILMPDGRPIYEPGWDKVGHFFNHAFLTFEYLYASDRGYPEAANLLGTITAFRTGTEALSFVTGIIPGSPGNPSMEDMVDALDSAHYLASLAGAPYEPGIGILDVVFGAYTEQDRIAFNLSRTIGHAYEYLSSYFPWKEGNDIDWWTKEEFGGVDRPFERAMITQGLLDQGLWRDLTANKRGAKFGIRAYHDPLAVP